MISIAGGAHVSSELLDATADLEYRLEKPEADLLVGHDPLEGLVFEIVDALGVDDVILTTVTDYSADPMLRAPRRRRGLPDVIRPAPWGPSDL